MSVVASAVAAVAARDGVRSQVVKPTAKKLVAIVVPLSNPMDRRPEAQVSLRHLEHHLGHYDRFVVAAESLEVNMPGYQVERFDDSYFGSLRAHDRLMLSAEFYERFQDYEFILTYHTDALVFSDQLREWCETEYDYIPSLSWLWHLPEPRFFIGNGGFALRRVEAFLRVFRSTREAEDPDQYWRRFCEKNPTASRLLHWPRRLLKRLHRFNSVQYEIERGMRERLPEDFFIVERAAWYAPGFRIAPLDVALRFGFDDAPRMCWELSGGRLPFGCHGWFRRERAFWEPFLLK